MDAKTHDMQVFYKLVGSQHQSAPSTSSINFPDHIHENGLLFWGPINTRPEYDKEHENSMHFCRPLFDLLPSQPPLAPITHAQVAAYCSKYVM